MLIAWRTVNAVRSPASAMFSKGFPVVTPGITIKDRLRAPPPENPGSHYRDRDRDLAPSDMPLEVAEARAVETAVADAHFV